jgi:GNAT superfamily N-acetyltransferase
LSVLIRQLQPTDIADAITLQRHVYQTIPSFSEEQFQNLLRIFPQGQFVAELDGHVVGLSISLVILWDTYSLRHSWPEITNEGHFDTHDLKGRTLYGAEVCVDPTYRGQGVGQALYAARRNLCQAMNLKRIIAGGRLPDYHKYSQFMSPEEYAKQVIWGDLYDPVLRFQLDQGFDYCGILHGYLPSDLESIGNAALIVWLNRDYDETQPTRMPS